MVGESYGHKNPHLVQAFSDSLEPIKSAFDDLNTVERRTILDSQSSAGISALRDITTTTGTGDVPGSQTSGEVLVETGTTSGSTAQVDTAIFGQYVAGYIAQQGIGIRAPSQPSSDEEIKWGYYGDNDGFYWGYDSTGMYVARLRDGTVEEKVYRSNWNGVDPDDLRDTSGTQFTPAEGAVFQIDFAWYGYGAVEFRIVTGADDNEQSTTTVHRFSVDQESTITNPNQPIRVEVDNGTTTNNTQVYFGGRQFSILGEPSDNFRITSQANTGASVSSGAWTHVLTMRRKSGDNRHANTEVKGMDINTDSDVRVALVLNANLSSTSFSAPDLVPASETALEQSTTGTFDGIGSGVKIWEGYVSSSQGNASVDETLSGLLQVIPRNQPVSVLAWGDGSTANVDVVLRIREEW